MSQNIDDNLDRKVSRASHVSHVSRHNTKGIDEHLAAALADHRPDPWGKGHIKLYMFCSLVFLCSTMNGYDGSLMGSINALPTYCTYYGLPTTGNASTGLVFAIFYPGQMVAGLFNWLIDWRGRKFPILLGCFGVIIATIITSVAPTLGVFIGGRFLLSFFCTIATTAAPLYCIEMAPPLYRGTVAGLYNTLWFMGSVIATSAVYGASLHLEGNLQWRLPLWLQMLCPGIVCIGIMFCPESPRWLIGKGRIEEARRILVELHANGDENSALVALEMEEMQTSLTAAPMTGWKNFFDFRVLFRTKGRRYRMMLNIAMAWLGQFSGNNVISYYLPSMLRNNGIVNVDTQLLLNIIYALVGWIFAVAGTRFLDIFGRRQSFLTSLGLMVICLAIVSGGAAGFVHTGSTACSAASIAFIYGFDASFAWALTPMQPIYPGEVMTNDMRAKGMGVLQIVSGVASFINTYVTPIALNNIGYWFYAFFVFWDAIEFAFVYFFFVETKGRTLEELEEIFEGPSPAKRSIQMMKASDRGEKQEGGHAVA